VCVCVCIHLTRSWYQTTRRLQYSATPLSEPHISHDISPLPDVNTNTSRLSHGHECQSSASHERISSPDHVTTSACAHSYTNRNKYHHLWYRNVIMQTSLSSEGKANERNHARLELTSCDVNNAVPFSATLNAAQKNDKQLYVC